MSGEKKKKLLDDGAPDGLPKPTGSNWKAKKVLCICAQFAPYFLLWYGFFLIVNDIVASSCDIKFTNCVSEDTDETTTQENRDLFTCPTLTPTEGTGLLLLIGGLFMGLTVVVQFALLCVKVGPSEFGSLQLVVWLEVAKENGTIFNILTRVSAVTVFIASVVSIIGFLADFDGTPNDLLNTVFQAITAVWTAWRLAAYDSPVTTLYHALNCPRIMIDYPWYYPSEDVMLSIHYILALDEDLAHDCLETADGTEKGMSEELARRNLEHVDAALLASLGPGDAGKANLGRLREFFSHPPTREQVSEAQKQKSWGTDLFHGAATAEEDAQEMHAILPQPAEQAGGADAESPREGGEPTEAVKGEVAVLRQQLHEASRIIEDLQQRLMQQHDEKQRAAASSVSTSSQRVARKPQERRELVEGIEAYAASILTAADYIPALQRIFRTYTTDEELYDLYTSRDRLDAELTAMATSSPVALAGATSPPSSRRGRNSTGFSGGRMSISDSAYPS
ncbi:hypothetical protein DIPPA_21282 [Diplonema papillatum]|nr:hypothetical protein DIPPA_21282 [Diplonema papillatum]|eukprot:gene6845-10501_t